MSEQDDVTKHVTLILRPKRGITIAFDDGRSVTLSFAEAGFIHRMTYDFCDSGGPDTRCVCYASGVDDAEYRGTTLPKGDADGG